MDRANIRLRPILSALWATMMFLYVYADVLSLYRPGELDDIRNGKMGPQDVSQFTLVAASAVVIVPTLMIFLSLILPSGVNRWINITAGAVFALVNIGNLIGETWTYYWIFGILEIVVTILIVWYAWRISGEEAPYPERRVTPTIGDPIGTPEPLS